MGNKAHELVEDLVKSGILNQISRKSGSFNYGTPGSITSKELEDYLKQFFYPSTSEELKRIENEAKLAEARKIIEDE